jgi:hypothetical protein
VAPITGNRWQENSSATDVPQLTCSDQNKPRYIVRSTEVYNAVLIEIEYVSKHVPEKNLI